MLITGTCHCNNLQLRLDWPDPIETIPVRNCSCSFCQKHQGAWTSNPEASLTITIVDQENCSKYRFGTGTADFYICTNCGVTPVVVSVIDDMRYAVVNVNTFNKIDQNILQHQTTDFDGEDTSDRLDRRKQTGSEK